MFERIASVFLGEDGAVQYVSSHRSQQWDTVPQFTQSSSLNWTMSNVNTLGGFIHPSMKRKLSTCSKIVVFNISFSWQMFCFQGKLMDGKVFDSSLSRDTLLVELGKRTVIAGDLQSWISASCIFYYYLHAADRWLCDCVCFCVISSSGLEQSLIGVCEG